MFGVRTFYMPFLSWEQKVFRKYKQLVIIEHKIMCQEQLQELRID